MARNLALDIAAWLCVPALFLLVYVFHAGVSAEAVQPHLYLVLLAWFALALARLAISRFLPQRGARATAAALMAAAFAVLLAYYALVVIGLRTWGRVISFDLIRSYAAQIAPLAHALGISLAAAAAAAAAAYFALFGLAWFYLRRFDWAGAVGAKLSGWSAGVLIVCGAAVCALEIYSFAAAPPVARQEPLSLTFFPSHVAHDKQGYVTDPMRAGKLDLLEDRARATYDARDGADRRNVVLIVVDALRPDRMGVYGYARDTTPHLARLAQSGAVRRADQVRASCTASSCGLMSLLSSKFVHEFSNRPFTLQQALKRHGYRIHMMLGGDHVNFYGLRSLYGELDSYYDASMAPGRYPNDDRVLLERAAALAPWDGVPVMMQFHFMSAHPTAWREERYTKFVPAANYFMYYNRSAGGADRAGNFYDNGVVQADAVIHELLATLAAKGYLRDTLVVITADHGESLGERGVYLHANSTAEEELRIPLLLVAYGYRPPGSWDEKRLAGQVDIAPTILAELGMSRPATWSGVALQNPAGRDYTYFQQRHTGGVIDHRQAPQVWKYWVDSRTGDEYAVDLAADPSARDNVIAAVPLERRQQWRLQYLQMTAGGAGMPTSNEALDERLTIRK